MKKPLACARGALLASQRKSILIFARDRELAGNVLPRFWHGIHTILFFISGLINASRWWYRVAWSAKMPCPPFPSRRVPATWTPHRRQSEFHFSGGDSPRRVTDGFHAGGLQTIHRHARNPCEIPASSKAMRDVAVVFARLVGAAQHDFVQLLPVSRMALHQRAKGNRCQIVGPNGRKTPAVPSDRCSNRIADKYCFHVSSPYFRVPLCCAVPGLAASRVPFPLVEQSFSTLPQMKCSIPLPLRPVPCPLLGGVA